MVLMTSGVPLSWSETKKYASVVRREGIRQFIRQYHKLSKSTGAALYFGDEIEYTLIHIDPKTKDARVLLIASELIPYMQWEENKLPPGSQIDVLWRPEYAAYMIEGTPGKPFGHLPEYMNTVEFNMQKRREQVQKRLPENCYIMCLSAFPRLGCPDFTFPPARPTPTKGSSRSLFYPEEAINDSIPRFRVLTRNIRERRGSKVAINVPIFHDNSTPRPFIEDFSALDPNDTSSSSDALPDHVYMDAMGFGMGCCCLQVTFQGCCISEARMLYDQLTTICPMMMALSAATPVIRGYLLDTDCRWDIVSASVDDRTEEERGLKPLEHDRFRIQKSRYGSVSAYISPEGESYNDTNIPFDCEIYAELQAAGIDDVLARHIAHLFIRDPIALYAERLQCHDEDDTDHFENIQSTNWQSMRFKPPPPGTDIGWRVEFRPMEVQLTDFENAAFATFVVLLTRTILSLKLNFLIPISKVEENMRNAVKRDAVNQERFHFRRGDLIFHGKTKEATVAACRRIRRSQNLEGHIAGDFLSSSCSSQASNGGLFDSNVDAADGPPSDGASTCSVEPEASYTTMTINEIINGSETFPGLISLIRQYLSMIEIDPNTAFSIHQYLNLISRRASGELPTTARWLRYLIQRHPDYRGDSVVSVRITNDLVAECLAVSQGEANKTEILLHGMTSSRTRSRPSQATLAAETSLNLKRGEQDGRNTANLAYASVSCSYDHC
ncbi:Glutamate--cysteine ligase catalytic subunit [Taenia crassiceps]|uniref:Glutamate--cysteine ligase n=1 Tax=Taenia crassiceps TaxID=6207 RepID=A0ABR4QTR7_9CEST